MLNDKLSVYVCSLPGEALAELPQLQGFPEHKRTLIIGNDGVLYGPPSGFLSPEAACVLAIGAGFSPVYYDDRPYYPIDFLEQYNGELAEIMRDIARKIRTEEAERN